MYTINHSGEDVVDRADIEELEGADTVYEREEHKYVAEEKDFTQPQFFVAEEVYHTTILYMFIKYLYKLTLIPNTPCNELCLCNR